MHSNFCNGKVNDLLVRYFIPINKCGGFFPLNGIRASDGLVWFYVGEKPSSMQKPLL